MGAQAYADAGPGPEGAESDDGTSGGNGAAPEGEGEEETIEGEYKEV